MNGRANPEGQHSACQVNDWKVGAAGHPESRQERARDERQYEKEPGEFRRARDRFRPIQVMGGQGLHPPFDSHIPWEECAILHGQRE